MFFEFKIFFSIGDIIDCVLLEGVNNFGWIVEEIQEGMIKIYVVDIIGVFCFMYFDDGVKFLKDQICFYFFYWKMKFIFVVVLCFVIIVDFIDGEIFFVGIMVELFVDFCLVDICGIYDGIQNVCVFDKCEGDVQCIFLLFWYVFLFVCVQVNFVLFEFVFCVVFVCFFW